MQLLLLTISAIIGTSQHVEIKVTSSCSFPLWVEAAPNHGKQNLVSAPVKLTTGASFTYQIPSSGWAGRMWPKVGCDGNGQNCLFGQSSPPCPPNGCQPPADTKVEFFFPSSSNLLSWYDISLVDGYSQGVSIVPRSQGGSCVATYCNLGLHLCPQNEVQGLGDLRIFRNGQLVGCLSPCKRWNFPSPYGLGRPESIRPGLDMCCPTPPISSDQCRRGPVLTTQYVNQVHGSCPSAYSYAYDDDAGLHACPGSTSFDVTFCPNNGGGGGGGSNPPPNQPCTTWGWKFYDGYDIRDNDMKSVPATHRNDCQPACRNTAGCKAYSWFKNVCYLKSGASEFPSNPNVYSAVIC